MQKSRHFFCHSILGKMNDKKMPKNAEKYYCEMCDFRCSKLSNFSKHNLTAKHKRVTNSDKKCRDNVQTIIGYDCHCGKTYSYRQGLHQHQKKCIVQLVKPNSLDESNELKQNEVGDNKIYLLIDEMRRKDEQHQKERAEHKKEILLRDEEHKKELLKLTEQISNISTITNNTTNNNKFNLNFFLNTQCKDAMSIQSFMENLQLGCKELEHMGDVGYLNGMIDIFNNTLGNMDIYKRPLHCTDLKREVLYFKQGTDWEKDSEDKQHLKKLIKNVESKNYYNLQGWQKTYPESLSCDTIENQKYMKIATEALGGDDTNKDSMYLSKIMKHIIKDVHVK